MAGYQAGDVEKITGVKRTRLQQWLERGYIVPSLQVAEGHGTRNIYSRVDLYTIALFKHLSEGGFSRALTARLIGAGFLDTNEKPEFYRHSFLFFMRSGDEMDSAIIPYDPIHTEDIGIKEVAKTKKIKGHIEDMIIINLGRLIKRVDEKIVELGG